MNWKAHLTSLTLACGLLAAHAQENAPAQKSEGDSFLQIYNAAQIEKLSISINGQEVLPELPPRIRIGATPVKSGNVKILLSNKSGEGSKEFQLQIPPRSHHCLIVWGDFSEIPPEPGQAVSDKKNYNVNILEHKNERLLNNKVRATFVNTAPDKEIRIAHEDKLIASIPKNSLLSVKNLPVNLFLKANDGKRTFALYLSQEEEANPENLIIVFQDAGGTTNFKAFTEKYSIQDEAP